MTGHARSRRLKAAPRWYLTLGLILPSLVWAQSPDPEGDFIYHARLHDTLIGITRRLLREPRRWPEIQARNNIADPRRIPPGDAIRIPYAWLRLSPDIATVTAVRGQVREGGRDVAPAQTLSEGSRLETGPDGSVALLLADGSELTLQKLSVLALEEMRRVTGFESAHATRFKLESGRLQTRVKPHGDVGRFEISTPVAVSAVRGTEFRNAFEPEAGNATTETLEGLVAVSGSQAEVSIPADFGTRVARNSAPLAPVRLLPAPDLGALPATNSAGQLKLKWPAVPGAVRYRLQLAADAEFHSFLIDTAVDAPQADLPAPADGNYWLRIRPTDGLGLEGHDAMRTLIQHQLPAAPALVAPLPGSKVIGDHGAFTWSNGPTGSGSRYRLQIARDLQFSQIFVERDTGEATRFEMASVPPGRYFWRVCAVDSRGEAGDWSEAQEYTQRQSSPTPYPPALSRHEMQVHWDPQEGMHYRLQIARESEFKSPVLDQALDQPVMATRRLRPGTYYARVQTIARDGSEAPFGAPREFEVPMPLWLKIVLPLLPLFVLAT
jgi:hypothetical protein